MSSKKYSSFMLSHGRTFRVPEGATLSAIHEVLSGLDCPRSLAIWIIIRDDPKQLKSLTFNPADYGDVNQLRDAYGATKLVSKANFLETGIDTSDVAFKKFFQMEELCRQTNFRFANPAFDPNYRGSNVTLLSAMQRKIASVLVGFSPEELFDEANWGPGVTTRIKGCLATATNKFQFETGITRDLHALIAPVLKTAYPMWSSHLETNGFPQFDTGNRVVTVPKDAFTDRVIAIEPGLNLWFQKAIGSMIRKRLLVHGINLNSQEINQRLACKGSKDSSLATVDFSSASDTISRKLIETVLPSHWFLLMEKSRSHFGIIEDKPVLWNKFSSMGNGFTFELESLIFYCAASVVCDYLHIPDPVISVYGDDVVLPSSAFDLFSSFCDFLGFIVNREKSFYALNPFRESCGSHYFDGVDIKPIFIKKVARTLFELYRQLNSIRLWAHARGANLFCDQKLKPAWLSLFRRIPKNLRIFGPAGSGDGFIIGNFDEATPVRAKNGIEGYYFWQFTQLGKTRVSEEVGLFLDRLRNRSIQEYGNNYTLRGQTRVQFCRTLVSQWRDLGPWV
jgi:hypothetical protein